MRWLRFGRRRRLHRHRGRRRRRLRRRHVRDLVLRGRLRVRRRPGPLRRLLGLRERPRASSYGFRSCLRGKVEAEKVITSFHVHCCAPRPLLPLSPSRMKTLCRSLACSLVYPPPDPRPLLSRFVIRLHYDRPSMGVLPPRRLEPSTCGAESPAVEEPPQLVVPTWIEHSCGYTDAPVVPLPILQEIGERHRGQDGRSEPLFVS